MLRSFVRSAGGLIALAASLPCIAGPVTIDFDLSALATPGRYEYRYTVTNVSLATPVNWFSIDFEPVLFDESSLAITSFGLGNWAEQILSSVPGLPAQYDAYKTTGAALGVGDSEAGFAVQFTWLGVGTPGNQAFTIYDSATLNVLDTGVTTPAAAPPNPVPEPSTAALVLLALCGAAAAVRRRSDLKATEVHAA